MMNLFLGEVAPGLEDFFVAMLVAQAGWHMSTKRTIPENIRLVPQPAYSPELNPAEHMWEDLRENTMPNRAFTSLDELQDAMCVQLKHVRNNPDNVWSPKGRNKAYVVSLPGTSSVKGCGKISPSIPAASSPRRKARSSPAARGIENSDFGVRPNYGCRQSNIQPPALPGVIKTW